MSSRSHSSKKKSHSSYESHSSYDRQSHRFYEDSMRKNLAKIIWTHLKIGCVEPEIGYDRKFTKTSWSFPGDWPLGASEVAQLDFLGHCIMPNAPLELASAIPDVEYMCTSLSLPKSHKLEFDEEAYLTGSLISAMSPSKDLIPEIECDADFIDCNAYILAEATTGNLATVKEKLKQLDKHCSLMRAKVTSDSTVTISRIVALAIVVAPADFHYDLTNYIADRAVRKELPNLAELISRGRLLFVKDPSTIAFEVRKIGESLKTLEGKMDSKMDSLEGKMDKVLAAMESSSSANTSKSLQDRRVYIFENIFKTLCSPAAYNTPADADKAIQRLSSLGIVCADGLEFTPKTDIEELAATMKPITQKTLLKLLEEAEECTRSVPQKEGKSELGWMDV